jgi:ubiquitin carboxyl-terminal hydrolase 34
MEDTLEGQFVGGDEGLADSPQVIPIGESDEDAENVMDDYPASYIHVEENDETYFRKFPFAQHGDYNVALNQIVNHVQGGPLLASFFNKTLDLPLCLANDGHLANPIDGTVLPQLSLWLDGLSDHPSQYRGYYIDRARFWDDFATLVNQLLMRR